MVGCGKDVTDLLPPYSSKTSRATGLNGQNDVFFAQKCIPLVREKLTVFSYSYAIVGIYVSKDTVKFEVDFGVCAKFANMKHLFQAQIVLFFHIAARQQQDLTRATK